VDSGVNGEIDREAISCNIGKLPSFPTEAMSLIDHPSLIGTSVSTAGEDCLAAIAIPRPFVKNQHACKVREVFNPWQLCPGQEIVNGLWEYVPADQTGGDLRPKTETWLQRNAAAP